MSIKVVAYVPILNNELLPKIIGRFSDLGMECDFHPKFTLDPSKDSGLVSVRLRVSTCPLPQYENIAMLSAFEIEFKDFRYTAPLAVSPATNEKLKTCTKMAVVRMHATHTNALRVGLYFAAFLAELADGIVYMPRSDLYLDPRHAIEQVAGEITTYETQLLPEDWKVVPFTAWTEIS